MKKIVLIIMAVFLLGGCESKQNPIVTMEIQDYGTIEIELYPDYAPNTVANFVTLIQDHFYDGLTFHRLMPGFVLQGGDPLGNGTGGPGYTIAGEFKQNGFNNTLSHKKGIISMARATSLNSAGSQFFIVLDDSARLSLDNKYAAFGKVTKGMDIIDKIAETAEISDPDAGTLKENIVITKVTVDTFGETYKVKKYSQN